MGDHAERGEAKKKEQEDNESLAALSPLSRSYRISRYTIDI